MFKQVLSIFFITLFMATIVAPSILVLVDDSIDVSYLLNASEEEEETGKENNKELETFVVEEHSYSNLFLVSENDNKIGFTHKKHPKPHLNLISPPPEFI